MLGVHGASSSDMIAAMAQNKAAKSPARNTLPSMVSCMPTAFVSVVHVLNPAEIAQNHRLES
jgi:hypothetical protein